MSNFMLQTLQATDLQRIQSQRAGETRLGQAVQFVNPDVPLPAALDEAHVKGARFAIFGIPEDVGPRANFGNGGADLGFQAFLGRFLNVQSNQFVRGHEILLLGEVNLADVRKAAASLSASDPEQLTQLREHCKTIDERVTAVAKLVFDAKLTPVVIGGGHNNSYPLLKALSLSTGQAADAINLDPHCDFRLLEGRHSGNGFSYAKSEHYLEKYFVMGLHELKNAQSSLDQMANAGASFCSYQEMFLRREKTFAQGIEQAIEFVGGAGIEKPLGVEVDTDSISGMPVSAMTNCGISVADAEYYVYRLAQLNRARYLHLAEAAPGQHPTGIKAGMSEAGQILTALVLAFVQNH
ncbi:arginase [Thraustotheca clavata]|uniref:Arginase n=1 Tax=Thraustotheca clavata TaxID=74557 RepID=A0A1V9ZQ98_9STRA|nr:arginase [Thraustotheca clavata]